MTATGRPITLQTSVVAGLAGLFVIATLCTSLALLVPRAAFSSLIADVLPIAAPKAYRADQAIARGDLLSAAAETRAEFAISPLRQDAWLRLAAIDLAAHHRLTAEGVAALDHAYDALPYDLDPHSARLTFALEQFGHLTPGVQASVHAELSVWADSKSLRAVLQALSLGLASPMASARFDGPSMRRPL